MMGDVNPKLMKVQMKWFVKGEYQRGKRMLTIQRMYVLKSIVFIKPLGKVCGPDETHRQERLNFGKADFVGHDNTSENKTGVGCLQ